MPVRGADAVRAGVAAADDHHVLVGRPEVRDLLIAGDALILQRQELHGEMNPAQVAPRDRQGARLLPAGREGDPLKFGQKVLRGKARLGVADHAGARGLTPDEHARAELDAFGAHLLQAPVDDALFKLEVRDAVTQQPADAIGLLEHRNVVAGARELLRAGEASGTRADHRDLLAALVRSRLRAHPAFLPRLVDDRMLDGLDADRVLVDAQDARFLARRRADAPGELRKVVGGVQGVDRVLPVLPVNEIVEVGNDVVDRAALHAERDPAVHAARALHSRRLVVEAQVELAVVLAPRLGRLVRLFQALVLQEPRDLAHCVSLTRRLSSAAALRAPCGIPSGTPSRTSPGTAPSRQGWPARAWNWCSARGSRSGV